MHFFGEITMTDESVRSVYEAKLFLLHSDGVVSEHPISVAGSPAEVFGVIRNFSETPGSFVIVLGNGSENVEISRVGSAISMAVRHAGWPSGGE